MLNRNFNKMVKKTDTGFKINIKTLTNNDLFVLGSAATYFSYDGLGNIDIKVKRSGTGLCIMIDIS